MRAAMADGYRLGKIQRYAKPECDMRNLKATHVMRRRHDNAKRKRATCKCKPQMQHANANHQRDMQMRTQMLHACVPQIQSARVTKCKLDNAQVRRKASISKYMHDKSRVRRNSAKHKHNVQMQNACKMQRSRREAQPQNNNMHHIPVQHVKRRNPTKSIPRLKTFPRPADDTETGRNSNSVQQGDKRCERHVKVERERDALMWGTNGTGSTEHASIT